MKHKTSAAVYNKAIDEFKRSVLSNNVLDAFLDDNHISLLSLRIWIAERFFNDYFYDDEDFQLREIHLDRDEVFLLAHHPEFIADPIADRITENSSEYASIYEGSFRGTEIFRKKINK